MRHFGIPLAIGASLLSSALIWGCMAKTTDTFERVSFNCDTDAECAALPPCKLKPGCDGGPNTEPYRLVGYGCVGAAGPIYRDEEDEFPRCKVIEGIWE